MASTLRLRPATLPVRVVSLMVAAASVLAAAAPAAAGCPPFPRPLCRDFGRTSLAIDADGHFDWKGSRGPATSLADFGDGQASAPWLLCAWDDRGLVVAADIPAGAACRGASCWTETGKQRLTYLDDTGSNGDIRALDVVASTKPRARLQGLVSVIGGINLPLGGRVVVQLTRADSPVCFESALPAGSFHRNDKRGARGKTRPRAMDPVPALPSFGCTSSLSPYPAGRSSVDGIEIDELERTFRVHLPSSYRSGVPAPVVFLLHGESGSGAQVEASSGMQNVAASEGFVVVSPDGVEGAGGARTWGAAGVDDVLFLEAVLDMLEMTTCIDLRRVYVAGVSDGANMARRLGCEAADRFRAVAGAVPTGECASARPVPVLAVQGQGYAASRTAWEFFTRHPRR